MIDYDQKKKKWQQQQYPVIVLVRVFFPLQFTINNQCIKLTKWEKVNRKEMSHCKNGCILYFT